jgi:hypothetical protein
MSVSVAGIRFVATSVIAAVCIMLLLAPAPAVSQTRLEVSVEFRTALEPHGRWERHDRWGEIWIPERDRDWRPYTVGRWAYTDDWGWYWVSADEEADWGWVVYHYGRWAQDRGRWIWIPGREWAPAWVLWRRGSERIGWAPLPPDEIIVEYRERPEVWIAVRSRDFTTDRIVRVQLPPPERIVFIRETVVVNRTVVVRDRGPVFAVNPGVEPAIIAAEIRQPIRTYEIRPRVIAGTAQIRGAIELRGEDLRAGRLRERAVTVRETQRTIAPAERVPEPRPLAADERGRLGDQPPRAVREAQPQPGLAGPEDRQQRDTDRRRELPAREGEPQRPIEERKGREAEQQRDREQRKGREAEQQRERDQRRGREAEQQREREQRKGREAEQQREREQRKGREAEQQREREQRKGREAEQQREREQRKGREAEQQRERRGSETEGRGSEDDKGRGRGNRQRD